MPIEIIYVLTINMDGLISSMMFLKYEMVSGGNTTVTDIKMTIMFQSDRRKETGQEMSSYY